MMRRMLAGILFAWLCGVPGASTEEAQAPADAVLVEATGPVEIQRLDEDQFSPAEAGAELWAGDTLRTGTKGRAFVKMGEEIQLRLGSDTVVEIQPEDNIDRRNRGVSCYLGVLLAKIVSSGKEVPFEVHTSNAVAGVRGTEFSTAVALDGSVRTTVTEGRVSFEGDQGRVDLAPGQYSLVEADEVPSAPAQAPEGGAEAWLQERRQRILAGAPELAERWMNRIERLQGHLVERVTRARKLSGEVDELARKARVARHGKHQQALRRIRRRMIRLVREAVVVRRQIRRTVARLRARTFMLQRLVADAEVRAALKPEAVATIRGWGQKQQALRSDLRKLRRDALLGMRHQVVTERRLVKQLKLRYRDFLRDRVRKHKTPDR